MEVNKPQADNGWCESGDLRETGESYSISARRKVGTIGLGVHTCRAHSGTSSPRLAGSRQLHIAEACFYGHQAAAPEDPKKSKTIR